MPLHLNYGLLGFYRPVVRELLAISSKIHFERYEFAFSRRSWRPSRRRGVGANRRVPAVVPYALIPHRGAGRHRDPEQSSPGASVRGFSDFRSRLA